MDLILRQKIFLSFGHGFNYFVVDRRVQQSSLLIIAGATLNAVPSNGRHSETAVKSFPPDKAGSESIGLTAHLSTGDCC